MTSRSGRAGTGSDRTVEKRPKLRWWERLDRLAMPFYGPAQVGPYDPTPSTVDSGGRPCPLCGALFADHGVDRTGGFGRFYCPTDGERPAAA